MPFSARLVVFSQTQPGQVPDLLHCLNLLKKQVMSSSVSLFRFTAAVRDSCQHIRVVCMCACVKLEAYPRGKNIYL